MAPTLKVLLPTSGSAYPPTEPSQVNSVKAIPIETPGFKGEISIWVKDYNGLHKKGDGHEYFEQNGRKNNTYAVIAKGRFLKPISADDILFGNVFEKPIRDSLPWGTSIAMKFMNFVDPTLEMDPYADKPWALSPALASMNYISLHKGQNASSAPSTIVTEDSYNALDQIRNDSQGSTPAEWSRDSSEGVAARRKWFARKENRQSVILDDSVEVEMEFCNGFIDFNTLDVVLPKPFSLHVSLTKYWDGQPATYVCRTRDGETLWSVAFQIETASDATSDAADDDDDNEAETEQPPAQAISDDVD